jgi:hypothetical protein
MGTYKKRKISRNSKRLRTNLKYVIVISTLIIAILYSFIKLYQNKVSDFTIAIAIFIIPGVQLVLLGMEEGLFTDKIFQLIGKIHKDPYVGNWNLKIFYDNNLEHALSGNVVFYDSVSGLRMEGGKITNDKNEVQVFEWHSHSVELLEYKDEVKLIYTYFTYNDATCIAPTKIGLAILSRNDESKPFVGTFKDYEVANGKTVKEGNVSLIKS